MVELAFTASSVLRALNICKLRTVRSHCNLTALRALAPNSMSSVVSPVQHLSARFRLPYLPIAILVARWSSRDSCGGACSAFSVAKLSLEKTSNEELGDEGRMD